MASIVICVLKTTVGTLVDKGRKMAAEKLKEGDVTDEQFRRLVVREIDEIKSKLDGLARTNLLASISFFKEGLVYLYKVLDLKTTEEDGKLTAQRAMEIEQNADADSLHSTATSEKTVSLAKEIRSLQLKDQDDSTTRALSDAKDRFRDARRKATEAFSNEALSTADRILAMQFRVMATLLEKVDHPTDALAACRLCLEELHSMPALQKSFKSLNQALKCWLNKDERGEIISSVCRVNRIIYDVTRIFCGNVNLLLWPFVDTGDRELEERRIDPLRDSRVVEALRKLDMEQFCVIPWSFGQEGEVEHKLKGSCRIATNTSGQFIIVDVTARDIKVFKTGGKFLFSSGLPMNVIIEDTGGANLTFQDTATDQDDNLYLLVYSWSKKGNRSIIYVFDKDMILKQRYNLNKGYYSCSLAVSDNNKIFVAVVGSGIQVYDANGRYLYSFGSEILETAKDVLAVHGDRVMVLDSVYRIHVFTLKGDHLSQFKAKDSKRFSPHSLAGHWSSEHVIVLSTALPCCLSGEGTAKSSTYYPRMLHVYTKDGEFVRRIYLHTDYSLDFESRIAVTKEGHVAMCIFSVPDFEFSILVF